MDHPFYICWISVDGAGSDDRQAFATLDEARAECDRRQRVAETPRAINTAGTLYRNPWGYVYSVRDARRSPGFSVVHRAPVLPIGARVDAAGAALDNTTEV